MRSQIEQEIFDELHELVSQKIIPKYMKELSPPVMAEIIVSYGLFILGKWNDIAEEEKNKEMN